MSLHSLAQNLQSAGRGQDSVLVHMTPKEVGGLQALAMAHGGSLTINPETGLPEAGFLSRILPMIAGFALGPAGFGLTAMQAGLATAAVGTAATGSLGRGLMMGLGAYGGAGLGAGLKSMATPAVPPAGVYGTPAVSAAPTSTLGGTNIFGNAGAVDITANPLANISPTATPLAFKSAVPSVTPGMTSTTLNQSLLNPQVNFASGLPKVAPSSVVPSASAVAPPVVSKPPSIMGGYADSAVPVTPEMTVATPSVVPPSSAVAQSMSDLGRGLKASTSSLDGLKGLYSATEAAAPYGGVATLGSMALGSYYDKLDSAKGPPKTDTGMIRPYEFSREVRPGAFDADEPIYSATPGSSAERNYFTDRFTALPPYEAPGPEYRKAAEGGLMGMAVGGPVETMSAMNSVGSNMMYPQANLQTALYSNPMMQRPEAVNVISPGEGPAVGAYTGEQKFAGGGLSDLGGYSDGGRLLKGPGDGVSDSIPAVIGNRQPARLADGEFVVPARIVSELGNGSTEAGARKLYAMMDRVQKARRKTVGKKQVARNTKAEKLLPA